MGPNGLLKNIYKCKLCGHKTNRSNNLKAHIQIHKRVLLYKCQHCGKKYQKRQDGKEHLKSVETVVECINGKRKKFYRCKLCGHSSNRSNNLKKHLSCHDSMKEFHCEKCGKNCEPSQVVNYHVKEIEVIRKPDEEGKSQKSFRCKLCGETFKRIINFRSHVTSHKPINIVTCKFCGKEYLCEKSLKEHSQTVHGEVDITNTTFRYKCEYCDQLFVEKKLCEEHRKSHEGEKPYICFTCNIAFRTQSSLYIHTKTHISSVSISE